MIDVHGCLVMDVDVQRRLVMNVGKIRVAERAVHPCGR